MNEVLRERLAAIADRMGFAHGRSVANWVPLTQATAHTIVNEGRGVTYQPLDDSRLSADEVYLLILGYMGDLDDPYVEDWWPNIKADLYTTWSLSSLAGYRNTLYARAHEMVAYEARRAVNAEERLREDRVTEAWEEEE